MGSKQNTLDFLFQYFPIKQELTLIDLFCGGGSVSVQALQSNYFNKVIMCDVIQPLINFYQELNSKDYDTVVNECLKYKINSKESFNELRKNLNEDKSNPYKFFGCCSSCHSNMMRFNHKFEFNSTYGKRTINDSILKKLKEYSEVLYNNANVKFLCKSFDIVYNNIIKLNCDTSKLFFYLDPPYLQTEAGYNCYWSKELDSTLYNVLADMNSKGIKFAMSNTIIHKGIDNPFKNEMQKYKVIEVPKFFNKAKRKDTDKESIEVLVMNF